MLAKNPVSLLSSKTGTWMRIHSIPAGRLRAQLVRIGLVEGAKVICVQRLPGGTIVLQRNRQQIAVGRLLAQQILVVLQ